MSETRRIPRIHRSRSEIESILARYRASRLSCRAFARQEGLPVTSLANWLRGRRSTPTPSLVPVRVVANAAGSIAPFELSLTNGRTIRVRPGFDADELRRLIATADGAC